MFITFTSQILRKTTSMSTDEHIHVIHHLLNDTSHVLSLLVTEKNAHLTVQTYTLYNVFFKVFTEKKWKKQTDIV